MAESITCQRGLLAAGGGQAVHSGERGTGSSLPVPPHRSIPLPIPAASRPRGLASAPGRGCGMQDAQPLWWPL